MEIQYQHQKVKKKQQTAVCKAAQERNAQLLGVGLSPYLRPILIGY